MGGPEQHRNFKGGLIKYSWATPRPPRDVATPPPEQQLLLQSSGRPEQRRTAERRLGVRVAARTSSYREQDSVQHRHLVLLIFFF